MLLLALVLMVPSSARARQGAADSTQATVPREVFIAFIIIDIPAIDVRQETFDIEAVMFLAWGDSTVSVTEETSIIGDAALEKLEHEIWWPYPEIENMRGTRTRSGIELVLHPDGTVFYEERLSATLSFPLALRRFPFDTQRMSIDIFPALSDTSKVRFSPNSVVDISPEFKPAEWDIVDLGLDIREGAVYGLENTGASTMSMADVFIVVKRHAGFYLWKIFLPLLLIMAISFTVFWMDSDRVDLGRRISVTISAMLTVVAFNFVMADLTPRISYLTFLDAIITLTYVFIAIVIAQSVVMHRLVDAGRRGEADRLERLSRTVFPLAYGISALGLAWLFLG